MEKQKAIEKLQRQIDAIEPLKQKKEFSPEFKKWRRDTEIAVEHIFGKDGRHLSDFTNISFFLGVAYTGMPDSDSLQEFRDGLDIAGETLESMIEEIEEYGIGENESKSSENVNAGVKTIFISHAAEDADLAKAIKTQIDNVFQGKMDVFVSSIPGKIKPGSDWLEKIIGNLIENSAFVVLVTPYSEKRPFVWFEIGFTWLRRQNKNCEIYAICAPPIDPGQLAEPLCRLQATSLASEPQTRAFFDNLTKQFGMGDSSTLKFDQIKDSLPTYSSNIIQPENTDEIMLTGEAKTLLLEAVKDRDGRIIKDRTTEGTQIQTNGKKMISSQEGRIVAKWEHALNELVENDFAEDKSYKGFSFEITHQGYEYADTLQDMSSSGTSASGQQDDLEFEKYSGTYISKEKKIRYCSKCFHSSSQRVPLQERDNGWRCSVCENFYRNPNYNPPTQVDNDYDPYIM